MSSPFEFRRIHCPTCGVDDTRAVGERGGRAHRDHAGELCQIVECRRCRLIYANPFPFPIDLDSLYSNTEGYFALHGDQEAKAADREQLVAQIERLVIGRRLLDVGAGLGETVAAARRRGWDAWGVETSSRFAAKANEFVPGRIFHCRVEDAPREIVGEPYDAIVLAAVLEHLHEPGQVLAAISRLLRPGGILFLDVPNETGIYFRIGNLWMRLRGRDWVVNLAPTFPPYHVWGFSRRSLTAMLRKYHLDPEVWHFYPGVPSLPMRRSLSGTLEWLGSRAVNALAKRGELGSYLECFARRK